MAYTHFVNGQTYGTKCKVYAEDGGIYVTSTYARRDDPFGSGATQDHRAIDMTRWSGYSNTATIVAFAAGTVTEVKTDVPGKDTKNPKNSTGNYVKLDHGNGICTRYLHLKHKTIPDNITVGAKVTAGQKLGYMGTTGSSTGPHLHFEVHVNGEKVDPSPYLMGEITLGDSGPIDSVTGAQTVTYSSTMNSTYEAPSLDEYNPPNIDDVFASTNSNVSNSDFTKIKHVSGVFGLPYQFLPTTDNRLSGNKNSEDIGYEYGEKIIERIPLLFLSPGRASFMSQYSFEQKQSLLETLQQYGVDLINKSAAALGISDLSDSTGRYYSFKGAIDEYYNYVNPACRIAARLMELQDVKFSVNNGGSNTTLDKFNWMDMTKSGISGIFNFSDWANATAVPFYVDAETSVSESFTNDTTQSMIASTANSISDMGRELNFLLGYGANAKGIDAMMQDTDIAQNINNITDMATRLLGGGGGFFSKLGDHLTTVASGGKLVFPEIWSDSRFSRSYNCTFKFISPDASKLSVYLNVIVPLLHLIALVAPQIPENNPNGYTNPFIIRASYKGFFNIDMGIITDMSVTKGAECQWTPEGVPTSIQVDIGIKDLYNALGVTATKSTSFKYDTLNNTQLMDYISTLCGINIFKPEIARMVDMWFVNNFSNRVRDFFAVDIWGGVTQRVQNAIMSIYGRG